MFSRLQLEHDQDAAEAAEKVLQVQRDAERDIVIAQAQQEFNLYTSQDMRVTDQARTDEEATIRSEAAASVYSSVQSFASAPQIGVALSLIR